MSSRDPPDSWLTKAMPRRGSDNSAGMRNQDFLIPKKSGLLSGLCLAKRSLARLPVPVMTPPETIICKPTPWFLLRAVVMLLMFSVFAVLFYIDGSSGYRVKNECFYLYRTFQKANDEFSKMNTTGSLSPTEWKAFAEKQVVAFPEDRSLLPASIKLPMHWPMILQDFEKMKPLQWNILWREYTKEIGLSSKPPEEPYSAQKINEQWMVLWVCLALAVAALFVLIRTIRRSISADDVSLTSQQGKRVLFSDMNSLDLRKWQTKGLAFINYDGQSGKGRIRLDGLTYGGFKKEQGEPAEQLMKHIQARFSGEVISYSSGESPQISESDSEAN